MKILIAIDDSTSSDRAIDFVARMRWPEGSRMIVVTVADPATALPLAPTGPDDALVRPQGIPPGGCLGRAIARLRACGFASESRLLRGDPLEGVVRTAHDERADLLVVGSHGRSGFAGVMLGNVDNSPVAHAPCSVLVVKKPKFA